MFLLQWVQCDRCERWQHQICALYNSERDLKGKAKYICPLCRYAEIKAKGHMPIPPVFGAQELPRTKLSDYIEQRLFESLQRERKQRAEFLGKNPEEVSNRFCTMYFCCLFLTVISSHFDFHFNRCLERQISHLEWCYL